VIRQVIEAKAAVVFRLAQRPEQRRRNKGLVDAPTISTNVVRVDPKGIPAKLVGVGMECLPRLGPMLLELDIEIGGAERVDELPRAQLSSMSVSLRPELKCPMARIRRPADAFAAAMRQRKCGRLRSWPGRAIKAELAERCLNDGERVLIRSQT
jgi:hypothetical protein